MKSKLLAAVILLLLVLVLVAEIKEQGAAGGERVPSAQSWVHVDYSHELNHWGEAIDEWYENSADIPQRLEEFLHRVSEKIEKSTFLID